MNNILVVAAHADDEVLGCAGTIAKHVDNGDSVFVIFMTDGVSSRGSKLDKEVVQRNNAAEKALSILQVKEYEILSFPDNQMDSIPLLNIVKRVEDAVLKYRPTIIYTHFPHDLNIDHRLTHQAVMTACRPQNTSTVKEIYCFEILSSTEWNSKAYSQFLPQRVVDISDYWKSKQEALDAYSLELREYPHSRSFECVEALAKFRGATHGVDKAEAFYVERIIT